MRHAATSPRTTARYLLAFGTVVAMISLIGVADALPNRGANAVTKRVAGANLLKNPAFEQSTKHWQSRFEHLSRVVGGRNGGYAARVSGFGRARLHVWPKPVVAAPTGARYVASAWVKSSRLQVVRLYVTQYVGSTRVARKKTVATLTADRWQQLSAKVNRVQPGATIGLAVRSSSPGERVTLMVDDASLVDRHPSSSVATPPPPEPSSSGVDPTPSESAKGTSPSSVVFEDNFNGASLDTTKWTSRYPWPWHDGRSFTGEYEWYDDRQVTVGDGVLNLKATRGPHKGTDGVTYPYMSGVVTTGGKQTFTYGLIEARVKIPKMAGPAWSATGNKLWPAFWLCPAASYESGASTYPEIDVFEFFGDSANPATTYHYTNSSGQSAQKKQWYKDLKRDFGGSWVTWGLDWQPGMMRFLIDGQEVFRVDGSIVPSKPMFVMLNMAVGKDVWGSPGPETPDNAVMQVDWVRVTKG